MYKKPTMNKWEEQIYDYTTILNKYRNGIFKNELLRLDKLYKL